MNNKLTKLYLKHLKNIQFIYRDMQLDLGKEKAFIVFNKAMKDNFYEH